MARGTPDSSRNVRRLRWFMASLVVLALAAGITVVSVLRSAPAPEPVSLSAVPVDAGAAGPPAGRWDITDGSGFVGYRISEPPDVTIVGRTTTVSGQLQVRADDTATTLVEATVTADLRDLASDASGRDSAIRGRILESDDYPEAVFTIDEPVELAALVPGQPLDVTVDGELTVRQQTRPVTADLAVRWDGAAIRLVGSMDISLADFTVEVPTVAGVPTMRDAAVIEIDLVALPVAGAARA